MTWTRSELDLVGATAELRVSPRRADGALRPATRVWVVRVGADLYVRSWRGRDGAWFRAARDQRRGRSSAGGVERDVAFVGAETDVEDAVDAAYREKYGRHSGHVEPMVSWPARDTTLKLVPRTGAAG